MSWGQITRHSSPTAIGMSSPMRCNSCRLVHDAGKVKVESRYSDCSMWRCPGCGLLLDDRRMGWGNTTQLDRRDGTDLR